MYYVDWHTDYCSGSCTDYVMYEILKKTPHPVALLDTGTPSTSREIYSEDADDGTQTQNPSVITAQQLLLGRSWVYPVCVLHHYIFIISQLLLTLKGG